MAGEEEAQAPDPLEALRRALIERGTGSQWDVTLSGFAVFEDYQMRRLHLLPAADGGHRGLTG